MSTQTYPRVETIVVPDDIKLEHTGSYATHRAHEILSDVGIGGLVPRSARLVVHPSDPYIFSLMFDATNTYSLPKDLDVRCSDKAERSKVERNLLATGHQEVPSRTLKTRGAK